MPGVAFQSTLTIPIARGNTTFDPPACQSALTPVTTVAAAPVLGTTPGAPSPTALVATPNRAAIPASPLPAATAGSSPSYRYILVQDRSDPNRSGTSIGVHIDAFELLHGGTSSFATQIEESTPGPRTVVDSASNPWNTVGPTMPCNAAAPEFFTIGGEPGFLIASMDQKDEIHAGDTLVVHVCPDAYGSTYDVSVGVATSANDPGWLRIATGRSGSVTTVIPALPAPSSSAPPPPPAAAAGSFQPYRYVLVQDRSDGNRSGTHVGADIDAFELVRGGTSSSATQVQEFDQGPGDLGSAADVSQVLGAATNTCNAATPGFVSLGGEHGTLIVSMGQVAEIRAGDTLIVRGCADGSLYDVSVGVGTSSTDPNWFRVVTGGSGVVQVVIPALPQIPVN